MPYILVVNRMLNIRLFKFFRQMPMCAVAAALIFAMPALAQSTGSVSSAPASVTPASLLARYPAGSITSVPQANRALAELKKGRAEIEARLKSEEKACYKTFLANKCVAEAKDRRRLALAEIKPIQIQADQFKRHDTVLKRDKSLADKRLKEEGKTRPDPGVDEKAEKFQHKRQESTKKEQSAADKRAENETAFEKKVQDRVAAQARVEEKRAKTEQRRKKKAASAAKRKLSSSSPQESSEK